MQACGALSDRTVNVSVTDSVLNMPARVALHAALVVSVPTPQARRCVMPAVMFAIGLGLAFETWNTATKNMMTHCLALYR